MEVWPPDTSPEFLERVWGLLVESVAIGVLGMGLALVLGVGLAFAAARPPTLEEPPGRHSDWHVRLIRRLARGLLAVLRGIPEIIWAYLLVRVMGLGPGPAVLAIGLSFGGILGKLYAELLEAADPAPIRALRRAGAGWLGATLRGALPQVWTQWAGYGLFRLECAVRSASILGVVGAGGLGAEIDLSIRYFQYDKLATTLLVVLAAVVALEVLSRLLRGRHPGWILGLGSLAFVWGLGRLSIPWADLVDPFALTQAWAFIAAFGAPSTDPALLGALPGLLFETVLMAASGTLVAAIVALVLAPFATDSLTYRGALAEPPGRRGVKGWAALGLYLSVRLVLQATRALPELVWALLAILWVGPGPGAGALAVGIHTIGILGRLFGETLEEAEAGPIAALERQGSGPLGRFLNAVLPQVAPRLAAYALFRFEVNVRATAMVGFVGAGGIGDAIHTAISLFHMADLATLLLALLATVILVDAVGDRVRGRLLRWR